MCKVCACYAELVVSNWSQNVRAMLLGYIFKSEQEEQIHRQV